MTTAGQPTWKLMQMVYATGCRASDAAQQICLMKAHQTLKDAQELNRQAREFAAAAQALENRLAGKDIIK